MVKNDVAKKDMVKNDVIRRVWATRRPQRRLSLPPMMHQKISTRLASKGVEKFKGGEDTSLVSGIFRNDGFPGGRAQYIALQWVMT